MRARLPALLHAAGRTAALMWGAVRTGPRRSLGRSVPATSRPVDRPHRPPPLAWGGRFLPRPGLWTGVSSFLMGRKSLFLRARLTPHCVNVHLCHIHASAGVDSVLGKLTFSLSCSGAGLAATCSAFLPTKAWPPSGPQGRDPSHGH